MMVDFGFGVVCKKVGRRRVVGREELNKRALLGVILFPSCVRDRCDLGVVSQRADTKVPNVGLVKEKICRERQ